MQWIRDIENILTTLPDALALLILDSVSWRFASQHQSGGLQLTTNLIQSHANSKCTDELLKKRFSSLIRISIYSGNLCVCLESLQIAFESSSGIVNPLCTFHCRVNFVSKTSRKM